MSQRNIGYEPAVGISYAHIRKHYSLLEQRRESMDRGKSRWTSVPLLQTKKATTLVGLLARAAGSMGTYLLGLQMIMIWK